jgi:hypothetical protein
MSTESWMLFYKGTGLEMPFKNKDKCIKVSEDSIITGLKYGVSLEQQKQNIIYDLDEMEQYLCDTFKNKEWNGEDLKQTLGEEQYYKFCRKWLINIISALKLKLIDNNNNNGHLNITTLQKSSQ